MGADTMTEVAGNRYIKVKLVNPKMYHPSESQVSASM